MNTLQAIAGLPGIPAPVKNHYVHPSYMDVTLPAGQSFEQTVGATDNAFIFVIKGELAVGQAQNGQF